jgi:hypothetical protein
MANPNHDEKGRFSSSDSAGKSEDAHSNAAKLQQAAADAHDHAVGVYSQGVATDAQKAQATADAQIASLNADRATAEAQKVDGLLNDQQPQITKLTDSSVQRARMAVQSGPQYSKTTMSTHLSAVKIHQELANAHESRAQSARFQGAELKRAGK